MTTAPKPPEGLEPALHPDLEALMPEPAMQEANPFLDLGKMDPYSGERVLFWYTATQMREAILAATERAAKLAADLSHDAAIKYANGREVDFEQEVGAAIRGGGGQR